MAALENGQRALARNALHHDLVAKSLRSDLLDRYREVLEKIKDDLEEAYSDYEDDAGGWSFAKLKQMSEDARIYKSIARRFQALGGDASTLVDDYLIAGVQDAYNRKVWELEVDGGGDEVVKRKKQPTAFWKKLLGVAAVGTLMSRSRVVRNNVDNLNSRLERNLKRSFNLGRDLNDTLFSLDREMLPRKGHGNKLTQAAQNEYHYAVTRGRSLGRLDNSEVVEESIWLNLLDGHTICPICEPLHGMPAPPIVDEFGEPPIHVACQCYIIDRTRRKGGKWTDYKPDYDPYADVVARSQYLERSRAAANEMARRAEVRMSKRLEYLEPTRRSVIDTIPGVRKLRLEDTNPWKAEEGWKPLEAHKVMYKDLQTAEQKVRSKFSSPELNLALYKTPAEHVYNAKFVLNPETVQEAGKAGAYVKKEDTIHIYTRMGVDKEAKFYQVRGTIQHEIGHRVKETMLSDVDDSKWRKLARTAFRSSSAYGDFYYPWLIHKEKGFDLGEKELFSVAYKEYLNHPKQLAVNFPSLYNFMKEVVFRGVEY